MVGVGRSRQGRREASSWDSDNAQQMVLVSKHSLAERQEEEQPSRSCADADAAAAAAAKGDELTSRSLRV